MFDLRYGPNIEKELKLSQYIGKFYNMIDDLKLIKIRKKYKY